MNGEEERCQNALQSDKDEYACETCVCVLRACAESPRKTVTYLRNTAYV